MVKLNLILAIDRKLGIGLNNGLPWHLKRDLRHFQTITQLILNKTKTINSVIMGRKTFESIGCHPLSNRINVVVSRNATSAKLNPNNLSDIWVARDIEMVQQMLAEQADQIDQNFIVGGKMLYEQSIQMQNTQSVYLTRVWKEFDTDVKLDQIFQQTLNNQYTVSETTNTFRENGISYDFQRFIRNKDCQQQSQAAATKKNYLQRMQEKIDREMEQKQNPQILYSLYKKHEEYQYLEYLEQIMKKGESKDDRTQIGTVSQFGGQMRFDLSETFPLLTTKRTFMRGISEELLWFIKGSTNSNILRDKGVHIWDGNSSREFLDNLGFTDREVGDLGPVYGFQWRYCGAQYLDMAHDYTGKGIDQLANLIRIIKEQPESRRIIMSAWNVNDISKMALPPCHILVQFYVSRNRLSCILYQRSCDMGLGVPFNIASYALLTCMIAQVCGLERGEFIHCMGDMHVYNNHIEALQKQLKRIPRPFPYLELNQEIKKIDDFKMEDIKVVDYEPLTTIKMQMAV